MKKCTSSTQAAYYNCRIMTYYKSLENRKNWISGTQVLQPSSQNKDLKTIILSSVVLRSVLIPSKARLFHSHQMIHIRHKGMAFQQLLPLSLPNRPVQPSQQVPYTAKHNPLLAKQLQTHIPKFPRILTTLHNMMMQ